MSVTEFIKDKLMTANCEYIESSDDRFNFWEQHVKLVVKEALLLAEEYGADKEIVELGALLMGILSHITIISRCVSVLLSSITK